MDAVTLQLMDMSISMDGIISDHEWHLLILKAKGSCSIRCCSRERRVWVRRTDTSLLFGHVRWVAGIRQGLSIRVINEDFRSVRSNSHMVRRPPISRFATVARSLTMLTYATGQEYMIRVVDIESGVVWFTRKRFREFHKLYRKVSADCTLNGSVSAISARSTVYVCVS